MRFVATVLALLAVTAGNASAVSFRPRLPRTDVFLFRYRAHDGVLRRAWLLLPADYDGARLPLVISPHGRGTSARANERLWGDLPGLGGFAVVNPAGEGRRLGEFSWGDPGQIADLARMPAIVRAHGVNVDPHRIYAIGGSMGGQETLLLLARHPRLLAGAAAFDPSTDMARRARADRSATAARSSGSGSGSSSGWIPIACSERDSRTRRRRPSIARDRAVSRTHVSSRPRCGSYRSAVRHSFTKVSCTRSWAAWWLPSITTPSP